MNQIPATEAGGERSVAIAGSNLGIVLTGDGNTIVNLADLHSRAVPAPADVRAARLALFGRRPPRGTGPSIARWLAADAGIVPLYPRRDLDALTTWAASDTGPLLRLVVGAGGQGKTVLAGQVCDRLETAGHVAGFARLPPPSWRQTDLAGPDGAHALRWLDRWAEIIAAAAAAPALAGARLLLVVDYAENQAQAVADLLAHLVGHPDEPRVKILLLARHHHDWWTALCRDHPDRAWVDPEPLHLESLTDEIDAATADELWDCAVDAFAAAAAHAGLLSGDRVEPRPEPRDRRPDAATTLDLTAKALLHVLDRTAPLATAPDADPLADVLRHEARVVKHAIAGLGFDLDDTQLVRLLLAVYLVPAATLDAGSAILARVPELAGWPSRRATRRLTADETATGRREACRLLGRLYPDTSGGLWSAPRPDRLPDTHLLLALQNAPSTTEAITLVTLLAADADPDDAGRITTALLRASSTPQAEARYPAGLRRACDSLDALILQAPVQYLSSVLWQDPTAHQRVCLTAIQHLALDDARALSNTMEKDTFSLRRAAAKLAMSERILQLARVWLRLREWVGLVRPRGCGCRGSGCGGLAGTPVASARPSRCRGRRC